MSVFAALMLINVFTAHGQEKKVPELRNLPLEKAIEKLEAAGFKWEIADSTFNEKIKPGTVLWQDPKGGSYVKAVRTIYLNINAFYPKTVPLPVLTENSARQGLAMLKANGFKYVAIDTVPSPYDGLILSVLVNGNHVKPGTKVSVNAQIRLQVGDGQEDLDPIEVLPDYMIDSLQKVAQRNAPQDDYQPVNNTPRRSEPSQVTAPPEPEAVEPQRERRVEPKPEVEKPKPKAKAEPATNTDDDTD